MSTLTKSLRTRRRFAVATLAALLIAVPGAQPSQAQARTWEERQPPEDPSPRFSPGITFDAANDEVVMFGGGDGMVRKDMWSWDGTSWEKIPLPGNVSKPEGRFDTGMVYDATNSEVVLFGGETRSTVVGDTWVWDGSSWSEQAPSTSPGARTAFGMVYDAANGEVLLFGGTAADGTALGDTWTWDGTTWSHHNPTTRPSPRARSSVAFDEGHGDVVLFGGESVVASDEVWSWDGASWRELNPPTRPSARTDAAMTYDGANGEVVLFGGRVATDFNDTWALVELTPVEGPNVGGGAVSGSVRFDGDGVPPLGAPCEPTSFSLEATADAVVANLAPTAYVGPVTVTGTGGSPCENAAAGAGTLSLSAHGDGASGSRIECGPLEGSFTRALADVTATLGGPCIVNEFATGNITFVAKVAFHPTEGDGVTTRVTAADFEGAFTVVPN